MTGLTHLLAGIAVGAAYANHMEPEAPMLVVGAAAIGGLLPDIDISTSKLGRKVRPASLAIQVLFGHRNLFHSPALYAALWVVLSGIFPQYGSFLNACAFGVATHIFLDCLNPAGIPLLYPITSKRFHFANFRSYGAMNLALMFVLFWVALFTFHDTVLMAYGSIY